MKPKPVTFRDGEFSGTTTPSFPVGMRTWRATHLPIWYLFPGLVLSHTYGWVVRVMHREMHLDGRHTMQNIHECETCTQTRVRDTYPHLHKLHTPHWVTMTRAKNRNETTCPRCCQKALLSRANLRDFLRTPLVLPSALVRTHGARCA